MWLKISIMQGKCLYGTYWEHFSELKYRLLGSLFKFCHLVAKKDERPPHCCMVQISAGDQLHTSMSVLGKGIFIGVDPGRGTHQRCIGNGLTRKLHILTYRREGRQPITVVVHFYIRLFLVVLASSHKNSKENSSSACFKPIGPMLSWPHPIIPHFSSLFHPNVLCMQSQLS